MAERKAGDLRWEVFDGQERLVRSSMNHEALYGDIVLLVWQGGVDYEMWHPNEHADKRSAGHVVPKELRGSKNTKRRRRYLEVVWKMYNAG